jgi:hypothetical protein
MFGNFFSWLRRRTCDAILGGAADALQQLDPGEAADPAEALAVLRTRLALPALKPDSPAEQAEGNGAGRRGKRQTA